MSTLYGNPLLQAAVESAQRIIDKHLKVYEDLEDLKNLYTNGYAAFCRGIRVEADTF